MLIHLIRGRFFLPESLAYLTLNPPIPIPSEPIVRNNLDMQLYAENFLCVGLLICLWITSLTTSYHFIYSAFSHWFSGAQHFSLAIRNQFYPLLTINFLVCALKCCRKPVLSHHKWRVILHINTLSVWLMLCIF